MNVNEVINKNKDGDFYFEIFDEMLSKPLIYDPNIEDEKVNALFTDIKDHYVVHTTVDLDRDVNHNYKDKYTIFSRPNYIPEINDVLQSILTIKNYFIEACTEIDNPLSDSCNICKFKSLCDKLSSNNTNSVIDILDELKYNIIKDAESNK